MGSITTVNDNLSDKCCNNGKPGQNQVLAHLSFLSLILAVLGKEVGEDVSTATGHMHQRAFLPQAEARSNSQHQSDGLDHQGPFAQIAPDNESTQDGLDLSLVNK